MRSSEITKRITLWATDAPSTPFAAALSYRAADPYAVRLAFMRGRRETVAYVFARSLLTDGLSERAGECDVTVAPHEEFPDDYLQVVVTPESGHPFALYAQREPVQEFLDLAYGTVPMGREHEWIDWEAELGAVLGGAA
jgi:hypothetical protein